MEKAKTKKDNLILGALEKLSDRLTLLTEAAMANIFSVFLLVIIYLFYWNFPQAKDLLVTINQESNLQIFLFFASLVALAGICWYLPRYFYKEIQDDFRAKQTLRELFNIDMEKYRIDYSSIRKEQLQENAPGGRDLRQKYFNERIPRILSTAMLLLVTLGILNVGNEINTAETRHFPWNISANLVAALLGSAYLFNLLLGNLTTSFNFNKWVHEKLGRWVLIYFALVGVLLLGLMATKSGGIEDLGVLLLAAFLISLSFLIFAICRKNIPFLNLDSNIKYPLIGLSVILSLLFLVINLFPRLSQRMNPLICANLSFVFYLTILYTIRFWGLRNRIFAVLFLLVGIFVIGSFTNSFSHHAISYLDNTYTPDKRLSLEDYFKAWVKHREDSIRAYLAAHPGSAFPVLIVSAEGGGSRAAFWTSRVHGYLENEIPAYYQNHLFALTGASGGTTGNSTFFAMKQGGVAPEHMKEASRTMFLKNYLSSSLTLLLGADLVKDIFGLRLGSDRAKQLEHEWSSQLGSLLAQDQTNAFKAPFLKFWYGNDTQLKPDVQPLLLINTTQVQGAKHALVSPVRMDPATYRGLDLLDTLYKVNPKKTIPLVTANLLNASFPYINPAGQIEGVGSFVDAGYFDNYGARVAAGMLKALSAIKNEANAGDSLYLKIQFISVLIRNSTVDYDPKTNAEAKTQLSSQLMAPVTTIANIRAAVNDHNFWDLQHSANAFFLIDLQRASIVSRPGSKPVTPIIPLARYLSPLAIKAMETSLDSLAADETSDLARLVSMLN